MISHGGNGYIIYPPSVKAFGSFHTQACDTLANMQERHERLRKARVAAGFERQRDVFLRHPSWKTNTYKSNENGNAPFSFAQAEVYAKAFGVRPEWLYSGNGPMKGGGRDPTARVIGRAGANPDDAIIYTTAHDVWDEAPLPPGGTQNAVALEVVGHSMRHLAESGSLIYFEDQHTPPTEDMIGYPVVLETADGQVLIKRLLRGSRPGVYDLESQNGATMRDVVVVWAAEITAIIPPKQAQKIIRRSSEAA